MPQFAIRADASITIGTGHLRRCLSLAHALVEQGAQVCFVSRHLDGVAAQLLLSQPFEVHWLEAPSVPSNLMEKDATLPPHSAFAGVDWTQDAHETALSMEGIHLDWLVVDHYAFDARWHQAVRHALGCRLLVVDDTADRTLDADALLDHNWALDHRAKYAGRLKREPLWWCGPRFALMSAAYQQAPRYSFNAPVRSIGIFLGGTDPGGLSACALTACRMAGFSGPVEVVSTSSSPHLSTLRSACIADPGATLTLDEPDLAAFFARHDLQIGAGGGAIWERCCIGAPTLTVVLARNQLSSVPNLDKIGVLRMVGDCNRWTLPTTELITADLKSILSNHQSRKTLSDKGKELVDGRGASRTAINLLQFARNQHVIQIAQADNF